LDIVRKRLLVHIKFVFFKGIDTILDLENIYALSNSIENGLSILLTEFEMFIKDMGLGLVEKLHYGIITPDEFVGEIVAVRIRFSTLIADVFAGNTMFMDKLDKVSNNCNC
jgi:hypothetical protein